MENKFKRSESESMLFGVCGGIAEYTKTDVTLWRLGFVLLFFTTVPIGILYFITTFITTTKN
jgi:phage shock protein C|tara:strand:+ start:17622 stop:17807 length:186 start_codon:yes stop_codon:yes gene_type:complete